MLTLGFSQGSQFEISPGSQTKDKRIFSFKIIFERPKIKPNVLKFIFSKKKEQN